MTDYDPNYTPDDDPLEDARRVGGRLAVAILVAIGLAFAFFIYIAFAIVCVAPGARCSWPFNY
jgi:hypothetical protein